MLFDKELALSIILYRYLLFNHSSSANLGLLNSISTAVILSAPKPSLVAKLLGQILSNMRPKIPLRLPAGTVVVAFLSGLLVGDTFPNLVPFLAGLVPVILFLRLVAVIAEPPILVVGEPVLLYFLRTVFLYDS